MKTTRGTKARMKGTAAYVSKYAANLLKDKDYS
jgi:hypothetical protein